MDPGQLQSGMNGLAIASLITSFTGLILGIPDAVLLHRLAIVGIVLGSIALNQIKQTRQDGLRRWRSPAS